MLEQRFRALQKKLKREQFNNVKFLMQQAEELEDNDPELALRILKRVENLKQQKIRKPKHAPVLKKETVASVKNKNKPIVKNNAISNEILSKDEPKTRVDKVINKKLKTVFFKPLIFFVILPSIIFAFYQVFIATERFESQARVIVQQPDTSSTMDAGMALLSGFGVTSTGSDTELVKAYIYSNDMLEYLDKELDLKSHYSQSNIDYFSRVHESDTKEDFFKYYENHLDVVIDEKSGVVSIYSQGFDNQFTQKLTSKIVKRAEWFINSIGHQLANAQLSFMQGEHKNIEMKFTQAQSDLLTFQQKYNLLDPTAEGGAMQQIAYTLEGKIAVKQTELKTLKAIMSNQSPQVKALNNELRALSTQLVNERSKLADSGRDELAVSEILAQFTDYKIKMDLALQAYTSSQVSLEKSRIEAYRQLKYLIVVEKPTLSEESKYPDVFYNISLFVLLLSLVFGIGRIIFATVQELK